MKISDFHLGQNRPILGRFWPLLAKSALFGQNHSDLGKKRAFFTKVAMVLAKTATFGQK